MIIVGSYASLLQGVSQQTPRERQVGQLSVQENMLSDPVTGLRRRPGTNLVNHLTGVQPKADRIFSQYIEVGQGTYNLFINTEFGTAFILDEQFKLVGTTLQNDYLKASSAKALRTTSMGNYGYISNSEINTAFDYSGRVARNPRGLGWMYIRTGAFRKAYNVTVRYGGDTAEYEETFEFVTDETAANSTPEGVMNNLVTKLKASTNFMAKYDLFQQGAYLWLQHKAHTDDTKITTLSSSSGQNYVMCSGSMNVAISSDLPAKLPKEANNAVCSVGTSKRARTYFIWNHKEAIWDECGNYESPTRILNMPIRFRVKDNQLELTHDPFEGRLSGDDDNNPMPDWIGQPVTGMSSYQGRLVLLSGSYITLSATDKPFRIMRSTVSTVRDDDPVTMTATSATSASFEHAVPFNKDLVLFSRTHQAVLPALQTALTSTNASVVMSSKQNIDTYAAPQVIGRTLMAATPMSTDFFGVMEFVPSQYTQSQYTPQTLTDHIPRYMPGRCRKIVGSNSTNLALFLSTTDFRGVLVHEYIWNGDERALLSWHHWTMPTDICCVHFSKDLIVMGLKSSRTARDAASPDMVIVTIDPKASIYMDAGFRRPFLDVYSYITVTNNTFTIPIHLRDASLVNDLRLCNAEGSLAGEPVGIGSIDTATWTGKTVRSFPSGNVSIGWKYMSAFAPTSPMIRDENDVAITSMKTMLMRYAITVQKSGEFNVRVDNNYTEYPTNTISALTWSSSELGLNRAKIADVGTIQVPCRSIAHLTDVLLSTDDQREMNVLDIEYTLKVAMHPERKRV